MKHLAVILLASLSLSACEAQPPQTTVTPNARLTITRHINSVGEPDVYFIWDSKSSECWIVVHYNEGLAMASAAPASCARGEEPR